LLSKPLNTASLIELELAGAAAASKITGCKNECRLKVFVHSPPSQIVMLEEEREKIHNKNSCKIY